MRVYRDFFTYRGGIYRHSAASRSEPSGFHSVRLVGWGEERTGYEVTKYWVNHWLLWFHSQKIIYFSQIFYRLQPTVGVLGGAKMVFSVFCVALMSAKLKIMCLQRGHIRIWNQKNWKFQLDDHFTKLCEQLLCEH